jgi:SAM-dependent methyltransferase
VDRISGQRGGLGTWASPHLVPARESHGGGIPIPPLEMRRLVGREDVADFDNSSRGLVYPYLAPQLYESVFDFGCGCGRTARKLMQQIPRPKRYRGVDLHRGMVEWCRTNLEPLAPGFEFVHHDVFHASFNPGEKPMTLPLPASDESFSLVEAASVFTHLTQSQAEHYLHEAARILRPTGVLHSTWFLFDRADFPMLTELQNALYTNEFDLSSAVLFDRTWVRQKAREAGLAIVHAIPPEVRNFQWYVLMTPLRPGIEEATFPADTAPLGVIPPPEMPANASRIGLNVK